MLFRSGYATFRSAQHIPPRRDANARTGQRPRRTIGVCVPGFARRDTRNLFQRDTDRDPTTLLFIGWRITPFRLLRTEPLEHHENLV
jgi:hypothetical protein